MADDKVDDESAQTGGEDESAAPKKSFGILAARFLQKGKSSPGSITGEFEALTPPESPPAPDSKMRKLHPVDEDEDEIREGSIHGMEVPLSESLYADIGLDDMSGYDDAPESDYSNAAGVIHAGSVDSAPPEIVYDIDAGEQPAISSGSGIAHEHASDIELAGGYSTEPAIANDESAQYEEQAGAYDEQAQYQDDSVASDEQVQYQDHAVTNDEQIRYHEESVASDEHVQSQVQYEAQPVAQANQYDEPQSGLEAADYNAPVQFEEQSVQQEEHPYAQEASTDYQDQAAVSEEPAQFEEPALSTESAVAHDAPVSYDKETVASQIDSQTYSYDDVSDSDEHSVVDGESTVHFAEHHEEKFAEHQEDQQVASSAEQSHANQSESRAYDLSALDAIGVKNDASFDKNALDEIGTGKEVSQGSPVSEAPVPEKKGLLGKFAGKKESTSRPTIGGGVKADVPEPKAETYDSAALESIGTKGFDKSALDSIGTKGFDKNALDSIGTKGFDKNALDSIGTQGSDKNALDSIGTRDFDKGSLDAIGEPAAPATDAKDKAAKGGGLLGGKFGQKAKGLDKPKLGGINPPSVDPTFDQKETGRFMVNADTFDAISASQNLTNEATQDFSAPVEETPALQPPPEEEAAAEKEPLSASFFDETDAPYGEEHTPVIGSDEIGRLITDADNAYRLHQYKAAEPIFANVLEKLDKAGDDTDPLLPYCLDKMADNLYKLKKYKESLQQFRRLLVLHTKLGSSDRDMIATLYKIAQTCEVQNLTSEADSMYKRAFRLGQQSLVPGDPLLAKVLEGYGTMLMRSEGAEAPSATSSEKTEEPPVRAAEVQSALSAEEIAMLNSLGASSDRSASEPSPIILSGGPSGPPEQAISKSRSPLKESDERADRVRATGPSGGSTAGSVWVRLGLFLSVIVGLILVTLNIKTDYSSHHVAHSKDFVKRVYKSADGGATFTIVSEDQASKDNFGKHFAYDYRDWNGTPGDDIEVISGQVNGDNFIYEIPQGIRDGGGYVFYEPKAAELSVVAKMHELGNKAQAFFKSKNKYPESKDLENIAKSIAYKNPFAEGAESVTANSIAWPPSLDATQIMMKSRFDTGMENGELWEGEPAAKPGQISAASASQKQPDASVLYIHGRDRDGKLITRADGKVLVLIYKNGIDVTPGAADLRNEKPGPTPTPMRLSKKDGSITALTILLSYIPIAIFFALSLVFLVMLNKGTGRVGGFSIPTFGIIWSPIMVLLTGLAKFVPAAYSTACLAIAGVVFVGGAGWLLFNILKNQPKKPKKS